MTAAPEILVTGATGFLGRHLLSALAASAPPRGRSERDHRDGRSASLALVRDESAWRALDWTEKLEDVETLVGSVLEPERYQDDPRLASVRTIVHLAAIVKHSRRGAEDVEPTNIGGTLAMVRLAARLRARLVFVSTSGTVACFATRAEAADEDAPHCEAAVAGWPYYRSKVRAEREARKLASELGVELAIVRPPIVLGPGDHRLRSTSNVLKAMRGKLPIIIRGGIAFVDVRDVAGALVRITELPSVRPVYHLPGTSWNVTEFFAEVEKLSGQPGPRIVLPFLPAWLLGSATHALHIHALPDPVVIEMASRWWDVRSKYAERELGYRPRDPRETLADTIAWLRQHAPT